MAFNLASYFLNKFKEFKPPKEFIQSNIADVILDSTNISVNPNNIECRNGVVYIQSNNPMVKSQIFLNKEHVLEEIVKKIGHRAPKDILFK